MIRGDTDFIARCLRDSKPKEKDYKNQRHFKVALAQWTETLQIFVYTLKAENSRFNRDRFCGKCIKEF